MSLCVPVPVCVRAACVLGSDDANDCKKILGTGARTPARKLSKRLH